ncbi:MAG: biosynthetic arginine decarboxylase [Proteobacteria bacterium]|nr:biosynthetic arginine decarboxylase [Pseudomonadota bacterium]
MRGWTIDDSLKLYQLPQWGAGFFAVNDRGNVAVHPRQKADPSIDLLALVQDLERRGMRTPLLVRFSDILATRLEGLASSFQGAIEEYGYKGRYRGVYPIKVNQQRHVVEELIEIGAPLGVGLEAGSKPELLVALALLDTPGALIICNGYKDRAYIETALLAQRLGRTPIIVIDRYRELDLLIKLASQLQIRPHIGIRVRLTARGAGKWVESSGDRSKFGLSPVEIMGAVERLRAEDMLDCLELMHFHIGSQISAIHAHKEALREASRIYVGLHKLGTALRYIDVGGGLGVDYDGSKTNFHSSMNYIMQEYANDVVYAVQEACDDADVPHPDIVSESGRALVAHQSVLIFDVLGVNEVLPGSNPDPPAKGDHKVLYDLWDAWSGVTRKNVQEAYHDVLQSREEATSLFSLGYLDLQVRAQVERLFLQCCEKILRIVRDLPYVPEDLADLEKDLADTYYGNFSVFQSAPDHWAVRQLFPVMPIHRLDEKPTRRGVFADLTCDSDGKIDKFIDQRDVRDVLELHPWLGSPYYIGVFLVGAYQEILGDLHNLFGDTDAVHVRLQDDGTYIVDHVVEGDDVTDVLRYVQYDRSALIERVRRAAEDAVRRGQMSLDDSALLRRRFKQGLEEYTYLSRDDD